MATNAEIAAAICDPVAFQHVLLDRKLWAIQRDIAKSLYNHRQTSVKGCHGSGKTYLAAGAVLQWLMAHPKCKVATFSPTGRQVEAFWREIYTAWDRSRLKPWMPAPLRKKLELSADRYAVGASSSAGVNVQGLHGDDVLIVVDEAPGVESDIYDAIEGIRMAGNVRVLKMGNPVVPSGAFYDSFHRERGLHNCISISAFDTPNLQKDGRPLTIEELLSMTEADLDYAPFPNLTTRRGVVDRYKAWGPTHPKYLARVLAQFPTQSPYSVFDLAWIERAKRDPNDNERAAAKGRPIQVGVDVAGAGADETTLCARVNGMLIEQRAWHDADPRGPVCIALSELRHNPLYGGLGSVVVDIVGIGYNFGLHLADQGFPVFGFQAGAKPANPVLYRNQKAEAYFVAREWFKSGRISGLADEECEAQLTTVLYQETSNGMTQIESKDDARKRGVASPDRAEALVMAFAPLVIRQGTVTTDDHEEISPY